MKSLKEIPLDNILFLDIETVPQWPTFESLPENWQKLWEVKAGNIRKSPEDHPATLYRRAGIYAEFGKVVCISAGCFRRHIFRLASWHDDDETKLLTEFRRVLGTFFAKKNRYLCAHNGKEFDFPYLARRMLINGLELPGILATSGSKPWEVPYLDTLELWRFGDYKNYTSLDLMTTTLGIPSPKSDITGADVNRIYWDDHDLARISAYCREDVVALGKVYLAISQVHGQWEFEVREAEASAGD